MPTSFTMDSCSRSEEHTSELQSLTNLVHALVRLLPRCFSSTTLFRSRIDHVENRLLGIKSRELYEAPAAVILHDAHRELECLCLSKQAVRFKTVVAQEYADLIYNGLMFKIGRTHV